MCDYNSYKRTVPFYVSLNHELAIIVQLRTNLGELNEGKRGNFSASTTSKFTVNTLAPLIGYISIYHGIFQTVRNLTCYNYKAIINLYKINLL